MINYLGQNYEKYSRIHKYFDFFYTFARMFVLSTILSALSLIAITEEDSIRTERLEEVVVTSNSARQRIQNVQTGAEVLQIEDLTSAPQLFGENDIIRSIQLLPGVKSESDASPSTICTAAEKNI